MEYRIERDSMGEMKVPADRYWAAQTQRSHENFRIGTEVMPREITHAFGILKKAAALANHKVKPERMDDKRVKAICAACDEVIAGKLNDHFPLVVWQTGSGTQSNMNANEVIANRGNEIVGEKLLHPNDDINMSQSSNDTFPTAMHIAAVLGIEDQLFPAMDKLTETFRRLEKENDDEIGELCDVINYMAGELSKAEQLKNDFISSVSHELRTPLTAIKGWAETIRASGTSDPLILNKGVEVISNECERLSGLVEDLLDFSRMQSGHLRLHMEKTDILAELEEAYVMYKEIAAKDGIRLEYRAPEQLPPVMADANRLKQVFINIIDNAVKYSSRGDLVRIEASSHDIYVQVAVKDTGCGIAAQDLGKVKERFYKANKTVRGSGIGLAVADEIIKQHNGILEIDSKENIGTVVTIVLPIGKPDTGEQTEGETHIEQV